MKRIAIGFVGLCVLGAEAAFARAMHEGVARDGSDPFPAFPFDHFTGARLRHLPIRPDAVLRALNKKS